MLDMDPRIGTGRRVGVDADAEVGPEPRGVEMNITIVARHCTPPNVVIDRAMERIQGLTRLAPRILAADLVFEVEGDDHRVEARLSLPGQPMIVVNGRGGTFGEALDAMMDRLRRGLRRRSGRRRSRRNAMTGKELMAGRA